MSVRARIRDGLIIAAVVILLVAAGFLGEALQSKEQLHRTRLKHYAPSKPPLMDYTR